MTGVQTCALPISKKFGAKILDYNEGLGVKILTSDTKKEYTINLDNIFSTRLDDVDFKEDKGE